MPKKKSASKPVKQPARRFAIVTKEDLQTKEQALKSAKAELRWAGAYDDRGYGYADGDRIFIVEVIAEVRAKESPIEVLELKPSSAE